MLDLHVHSTCSADGGSEIVAYARQAAAAGLGVVGLCEHVDFDPRDRAYEYLDVERYDREIEAAHKAHPMPF